MLIRTRYHGPTDTRGSRISARALDQRKTIPYPYEASMGPDAHRVAADALLAKFQAEEPSWFPNATLELVGETEDEKGFVFKVRTS